MANLETAAQTVKFDIDVVNIDEPVNKKFYDLYAFDVPVMQFKNQGKEKIVMHRITTEEAIDTLNAI